MKEFDKLNSCYTLILNFRPVRRREAIVYMDSKVTKSMEMRELASFKSEVKGKSYLR